MTIKLKQRESVNKAKAEELKKAIQTGGDGNPVNFHWKEDQAKEFIDYIKDESNGLLNKFRVIPMDGPTKEIAKILENGKFLKPGGSYRRSRGNTGVEGYEFTPDSMELKSKKVEGLVYISDDELQDNIEGDKWEGHVMQMVSKKIANEIVETALYGRELENPSGANGILNVFNGVKYLAKKDGNVVSALEQDTREVTRRIIIKGKKSLKTKYRPEVELLMGSDIKTDLDELYNDPNGNRGNGETIKTSVSGMSIEEVPLMTSESAVIDETTSTTTSAVADAGQKVINVSDDLTASIVAGDSITVNPGEADEMTYVVASINANSITTTENLIYSIPAEAVINKSTQDGAEIIITNPKNVVVGIQLDIKAEFERLAPDGWNVWYKMRLDLLVENPEAVTLIEDLKSKN